MLHHQDGMRQRSHRQPIQFPVVFKRLDQAEPVQTGTGWTEDLGEGGACLKLRIPLLMGCRLGLVIFAEPEAVEVEARVAWVRPGGQRTYYLHGVEFLHVAPHYYQSLIKTLANGKSLERRTYHRFPLTIPVSCEVASNDTSLIEGQLRNVSRGGAMIYLPEQLAPRTRVQITVNTPREEHILGKVRWVSDSGDDSNLYYHGIEFVDGPLETQRFLSLFEDDTSDETPEQ